MSTSFNYPRSTSFEHHAHALSQQHQHARALEHSSPSSLPSSTSSSSTSPASLYHQLQANNPGLLASSVSHPSPYPMGHSLRSHDASAAQFPSFSSSSSSSSSASSSSPYPLLMNGSQSSANAAANFFAATQAAAHSQQLQFAAAAVAFQQQQQQLKAQLQQQQHRHEPRLGKPLAVPPAPLQFDANGNPIKPVKKKRGRRERERLKRRIAREAEAAQQLAFEAAMANGSPMPSTSSPNSAYSNSPSYDADAGEDDEYSGDEHDGDEDEENRGGDAARSMAASQASSRGDGNRPPISSASALKQASTFSSQQMPRNSLEQAALNHARPTIPPSSSSSHASSFPPPNPASMFPLPLGTNPHSFLAGFMGATPSLYANVNQYNPFPLNFNPSSSHSPIPSPSLYGMAPSPMLGAASYPNATGFGGSSLQDKMREEMARPRTSSNASSSSSSSPSSAPPSTSASPLITPSILSTAKPSASSSLSSSNASTRNGPSGKNSPLVTPSAGSGVMLLVNESAQIGSMTSLFSDLQVAAKVTPSSSSSSSSRQSEGRSLVRTFENGRRARSISPSSSRSISESGLLNFSFLNDRESSRNGSDEKRDPVSTISQPSISSSSSSSSSSKSSASSTSSSSNSSSLSSSLSPTTPSNHRLSRRVRSKSVDRSRSGYLTQSPSSSSVSLSSVHLRHHRQHHSSSSSSSTARKIDLQEMKALATRAAAAQKVQEETSSAANASSSAAASAPSSSSSSSAPKAQTPEIRQQLVAYISSSSCHLFSNVQGFFQVSHDHLDALIHASVSSLSPAILATFNAYCSSVSLHACLSRLQKLDRKGKKFLSMSSLIEAVENAERRSVRRKRNSILSLLSSSTCYLFAEQPAITISYDEIDEMIAACSSTAGNDALSPLSSSAVKVLIKRLNQLNERNSRFTSIRALISVIQVMHKNELEAARSAELQKKMQQQQEQLNALQTQLIQQQVPAAPNGFAAMPPLASSAASASFYPPFLSSLYAPASASAAQNSHENILGGGASAGSAFESQIERYMTAAAAVAAMDGLQVNTGSGLAAGDTLSSPMPLMQASSAASISFGSSPPSALFPLKSNGQHHSFTLSPSPLQMGVNFDAATYGSLNMDAYTMMHQALSQSQSGVLGIRGVSSGSAGLPPHSLSDSSYMQHALLSQQHQQQFAPNRSDLAAPFMSSYAQHQALHNLLHSHTS